MIENLVNKVNDIIRTQTFRNHFKLYSLIFVSSFIASIIIGLEFTNISNLVVYYVKNYTSLKNITDGSTTDILINNFIVSLLLLYFFYLKGNFKRYFGIIYFIYIGVIAGFAVSYAAMKYNILIALSMIVPHGIIEVPTIIIAVSSGLSIQDLNTKKDDFRNYLISISILLFILLGIAGYIETNITPYIFKTLVTYYRG